MDSTDFNKWFNEKFEKFRMHDDEQDGGYEEWFRNKSSKKTGDDTDTIDYDDDIESDILVPGQVYDDLKELDKILNKTAHGNTAGALKKK